MALTVDTRDLLEPARSHDMGQLGISVRGVADDGELFDRQVLADTGHSTSHAVGLAM